ncbi:VOC family protein [Kitasatospora sp. NPDC058190]|uniref:VOC family protein n=1 Tax=Kitasatospora sp. NPDC058190 TaxID=3346371 RepID=UPI0036DB6F6C
MKALATLARVYVDDLDVALPTLRELTGEQEGLRFPYAGVEVARIGGLLVVAGAEEALAPFRDVQATVLVDDLDGLGQLLRVQGGELLDGPNEVPTGRNATARHPGGAVFEYVEFAKGRVVFSG